MTQRNKPPDFSLIAKNIKKERPRYVAGEAVKFFKEGFVKGGFSDTAFQPWKDTANPLGGKKILIGYRNTMNLMQSIRTLEESANKVRTGTTLIYGEIHNNGGTITVTAQMKKFWWARYYEFAGKVTRTKGGKATGSARNRLLSAKAEYCRNMALMQTGAKIAIPQRQYIGESKTLLKQFEEWMSAEVDKLK